MIVQHCQVDKHQRGTLGSRSLKVRADNDSKHPNRISPASSPINFYLEDTMCSVSGSSNPGLSQRLAKTSLKVSPSGIHRPWAVSNRNHVSGAQSRSGFSSQPIPFTLTTFLLTLQRWVSATGLIPTLQNSILGAWRKVTQAGFPPASLQAIASPHVQFKVRPDP
jgi:hypothetical protein